MGAGSRGIIGRHAVRGRTAGVRPSGVWPAPALPAGAGRGWMTVRAAVPYGLWWLVIMETVALAAEEAHEPHRTIPRGLVWAQLTLIGLVLLTWLFACGALDSQELAVNVERDAQGIIQLDEEGKVKGDDVDYPLAKAMGQVLAGRWPIVLYGF